MRTKSRLLSTAGTLVGLAILVALPWFFRSAYDIVLLNTALMFCIVVLGLNFIYGFAGIFSLAQAAFWGIGAYTSALLTVDYKAPVWVGLIAAGIVACLFGLVIGVPTLKLKTHYLTLATLGFAEAVRMVIMNFDKLTHGAQGIRNIPAPSFGPLAIDSPYKFYYLNLAVVALVVIFGIRLLSSRIGRALAATRDDELAARSSGVDVTYTRVLAFAISAFWAGIAGSLWAHFFGYISPETFDLSAIIRFTSMLVIGGAGTIAGPIVGSVLLTYLPEWLKFLESYYMAIYGLSLVVFLVFAPKGLVGLVSSLWIQLPRSGRRSLADGGKKVTDS